MFSALLLIVLVNFVAGAAYDHALNKMDRLLAFRRFQEAKELLVTIDNPGFFATAQILSRCMDLRHYDDDNNFAQVVLKDYYMDGTIASDANKISDEANYLLGILIPYALDNKLIITRVLNSAVFHADYKLMEQLIGYGWSRFSEDENGMTPLKMATRHRRKAVFKWLVENGADIHYTNGNGDNLVHFWAESNVSDKFINSFISEILIKNHNLDWKSPNQSGLTPLKIARHYRNHEVVDILEGLHSDDK